MAKPSKVQLASPSVDERAEIFEMGIGAQTAVSITFDSGITVAGPVFESGQPKRLRCSPGAFVSWTNGYARSGMAADGVLPAPLGLTLGGHFHTPGSYITEHSHTFSAGDRIVIYSRAPVQQYTIMIAEAVLIECESSFDALPALHASWPTSITGFTSTDVQDFLDDTPYWPETRIDWPSRYGRPDFNTPGSGQDAGYGGILATVVSQGAMLMCSNLSSALKKSVQDRLLMMADDLEKFGVIYPANGGHNNGKYILWLIRKAVRGNPATLFTDASFSETRQVTRDAGNNIVWSMYGTLPNRTSDLVYEFCCTTNRWMGSAVCAKLATFLGANTSDWVAYTIAYMTANVSITPAWYWSFSPRLATIFAANRATIGY